MNTVRLTGAAGRGLTMAGAVEPHAETTRAVPASIAIVLLYILDVASCAGPSKGPGIARNPRRGRTLAMGGETWGPFYPHTRT